MAAQLPDVQATVPPVLRMLTEAAWLEFLEEFETYRSQGGARPLARLLLPEVRALLEEEEVSFPQEAPSEGEEREILKKITALFAPSSLVDCFDRFRTITMEGQSSYSVEAVLRYNLQYARMARLCADGVMLSDAKLRDLYVRNLRPVRLGQMVQLEEPSSLPDARRAAVKLVKSLQAMQRALEVPLDRRALPRMPARCRSDARRGG